MAAPASEESPTIVSIIGPGGIGKTALAEEMVSLAGEMGCASTGILDLESTSYRSPLGILTACAEALGASEFGGYLAVAFDERSSPSGKETVIERATTKFIEDAQRYVKRSGFVVVLDDLGREGQYFRAWLDNWVARLPRRCLVVTCSRQAAAMASPRSIVLAPKPMEDEEADLLIRAVFEDRSVEYDLSYEVVVALNRLAHGRPILLSLAADWILEYGAAEELVAAKSADFERELVLKVRRLPRDEHLALLLMAVATRRFNPEVLKSLTTWEIGDCEALCRDLRRLTFVKHRSADDTYALHDEMQRLMSEYVGLPATAGARSVKDLVEGYYKPTVEAASGVKRQQLMVEMIYYLLRSEPEDGAALLDSEMNRALADNDVDYADLLANEISGLDLTGRVGCLTALSMSELYLRRYRPQDASVSCRSFKLKA